MPKNTRLWEKQPPIPAYEIDPPESRHLRIVVPTPRNDGFSCNVFVSDYLPEIVEYLLFSRSSSLPGGQCPACEESARQSYQRAVEEPCCRPKVPHDPLLHVQVILIVQTQRQQQHEYDERLSKRHEFRSAYHILCLEPLHVEPLRHTRKASPLRSYKMSEFSHRNPSSIQGRRIGW